MCTKYNIQSSCLKIEPIKLAEILYRDAGKEKQLRFAASDSFLDRFYRLSSAYLNCLEPAGFTVPFDISEFRNVFEESLPEKSPIYKVVDYWMDGAIFLVTIGPEVENSVKNLSEAGDLTDALFLDAMGSVLVEEAAEYVQNEWIKSLSDHREISDNTYPVRYSPGYCQWDVAAQEMLFACFGGDGIPVSLTKGGMMHPRKSISGIVVLEERDPSSSMVASCRICGRMCEYMRRYENV